MTSRTRRSPGLALLLGVTVAALGPRAGHAYMYDVLEPTMLAPSSCKHGCAAWTSKDDALWAKGKTPADAGATCAQPGKGVDAHPLGAWCYCAVNSTEAEAEGADPTHPLDGQTWLLFNTFGGQSMYISFADSAAPSGEQGSQDWMRATYSAQTDAMPLEFHAVVGSPNTYTLYNKFPSSLGNKWVSYDDKGSVAQASYSFLRANEGDSQLAMKIEFVAQGADYIMINHGKYGVKPSSKYISYCDSGCDSGKWIAASYSSVSDAMTVKLVKPGAVNPNGDYCTYRKGSPEQINVQVAGPASVVLAFVTLEDAAAPPTLAPMANVSLGAAVGRMVRGVTHMHETAAKDKTYYMHFVRVDGLEPRATYSYSVRGGGEAGVWSAVYQFRAPYKEGVTKIDVYGDMGIYSWNNMQQLYDDCAAGTAADLIVHMGDHAYNEGESDEARADGYMSAFSKVLAQCPWMPIVGNHEYYDGAELSRYLDSTWQKWAPLTPDSAASSDVSAAAASPGRERSTANSALGKLLALGNLHAQGSGTVPSGTSRYFSVDVGLVHLIALDLNGYYGVDPCGATCTEAQKVWLAKDMAAANANREAVPWVVAMSHYPFYCTGCYSKQVASKWYAASPEAEHGRNVNMSSEARSKHERATRLDSCAAGAGSCPDELKGWGGDLRQSSDASIKDLVPELQKYGVDMYLAGHWHYYESLWPAKNGATGSGGEPVQKNFVDPRVTVHVTTGNGGPPSADSFCEDKENCGSIPATRNQSTAYGYGRLTAMNASHMLYQQFLNKDGSLFDEFMMVQHNHGPFPSPDED